MCDLPVVRCSNIFCALRLFLGGGGGGGGSRDRALVKWQSEDQSRLRNQAGLGPDGKKHVPQNDQCVVAMILRYMCWADIVYKGLGGFGVLRHPPTQD